MAFRSVVTLSRRESEVAELVRDGLTNREIANRLFISERTVEGHVSQICNKLGFRSRIQIATRMLADDSRGASGLAAPSRPFLVVSQLIRPPWWVLGLMAAGAPLPVVAAVYQWTEVPAGDWPAGLLNNALGILALLFLAIPIVAIAGLASGRPWGRRVAIGGLLAVGSVVLLLAGSAIAAAALSPRGFQAADTVERLYAFAIVPLLLVHLGASVALGRGHPWGKPLATVACGFWILRFGFGLSASVLALWLLWSEGRTARGAGT